MKPTILFLFNSSPYALQPWLDDGRFNVVSVDYHDTDHAQAHREPAQGVLQLNVDLSTPTAKRRVLELLWAHDMAQPSLVISFPPCTDLAVSGARHFKAKLARDSECQNRAVEMAKLASTFSCPYVIENPVSVLATLWRPADYYWDPCDYAGYIMPWEAQHPEFPGLIPDRDMYHKKTGAWCGNGFRTPERRYRAPLEKANHGWAKLGGKSARTKYIRSLTPRGWARAVYAANVTAILHEKVVDKAYIKELLSLKRSTLDALI